MRYHLRSIYFLMLAAFAVWQLPTASAVKNFDRPLTPASVAQALQFAHKLINDSTLARTIEKDKFAPAMAYLNEARRLHEDALDHLRENNLIVAMERRDEAIRLAFEAGHLTQMAGQQKDKPTNDFDHKMRSINALLNAHATLAEKQGLAGDNLKLREQIKDNVRSATAMRESGDYVTGLNILSSVYDEVKRAVSKIRGGDEVELTVQSADSHESLVGKYETTLHSVNALFSAQQRIAKEKGDKKSAEGLKRTVTGLLESAEKNALGNKYEQAVTYLNQAYETVAGSIEQMRGGETLVRTLHFNTPEEEYHYELDRNDTYKMLIRSLIEDKKTMQVTERVQGYLDQADELRALAEQQAGNGDFSDAIKSLEKSTKNLIFAMRNAGFFIPG
ncbi:MAG: hypothetical protein OEZ16_01235 [Chromatiales bacterium]|nr:hypothetical protein [Chromatiales bacterium]